ncbi:MAG: inorganic phosphate transporter [Deltaproteobacteria bacterium]
MAWRRPSAVKVYRRLSDCFRGNIYRTKPLEVVSKYKCRQSGGGGSIEPIFLLILGAGVYVGWNIGANDTANCVGTAVGCGLISFRNAVILVGIFCILGALLQGQYVMRTIGKGIVKGDLNYLAVIIALVSSGFFVTLATFYRIPTSTSQAIVGGVVGIGLAVGAEINVSEFIYILESWILCPILVMVLAFSLMHLLNIILRKFESRTFLVQHAMGRLAIVSACYTAYALGANHAGTAVGPIANLGIVHPDILLFIGVGLVKGMKAIRKRTITIIFLGWFLTPTCAAAAAFLSYKIVKAVFA